MKKKTTNKRPPNTTFKSKQKNTKFPIFRLLLLLQLLPLKRDFEFCMEEEKKIYLDFIRKGLLPHAIFRPTVTSAKSKNLSFLKKK